MWEHPSVTIKLSERGAESLGPAGGSACITVVLWKIPLGAGFGTGNTALVLVLLSAAGDSPHCWWGFFLTWRMLRSECLQQVQGIPQRERNALSCLMGCQVLWDARSGSGTSTSFPFAVWCYSWLHCGKDLWLRERNSEGGQMAGVWTFFRPCAFWIHLLCFVCQNMSLLWATKATGFKINKCSPQG